MTPGLSVAVYSGVIVAGALAGAVVPLLGAPQRRLITFLAFAAGVMLGAAFFHMLPEAFHGGGYGIFTLVPLGFLSLFLLERYVFTHACEEPPGCEEHAAKGSSLGMTAFFGLAVHTLFDGVALGSAAYEGVGLTAFIAITAHKIPSSLSLASILTGEGKSKLQVMLYALAFGCMVPLGAVLYFALEAAVKLTAFAPKALAFSAGTFLYIAVSDLLPHINRHGREGRFKHSVALVFGLALMFVLSRFLVEAH